MQYLIKTMGMYKNKIATFEMIPLHCDQSTAYVLVFVFAQAHDVTPIFLKNCRKEELEYATIPKFVAKT